MNTDFEKISLGVKESGWEVCLEDVNQGERP